MSRPDKGVNVGHCAEAGYEQELQCRNMHACKMYIGGDLMTPALLQPACRLLLCPLAPLRMVQTRKGRPTPQRQLRGLTCEQKFTKAAQLSSNLID